jgi:Asp-tRNA(Asn)/Glu-tRNA(Gln) amidotransferase A subunit family amidase
MNLPWTHAGVPVVSIPSGKSEKGLPMGLQIIGQFMQDEVLLCQVASIGKMIATSQLGKVGSPKISSSAK